MTRTVKTLLVLGVVLTFAPPVVGLLLTVLSMTMAFHDLSQQGIANPQQLSDHIGHSLVATAAGLVFSIIGIVFLVTAGVSWALSKKAEKAI